MGKEALAYLVSADTGEITNELYKDDRVKITRKESVEYLSQFQEWKIEHFYKGHIEEIRQVMQELSTTEKAFLFSVATYVSYEDCCLKHDNGNELSFNDMVRICSMSRSTINQVINGLIEKDILYRGRNSQARQYFVNPWLFCKGNRINKVLKTMFRNYKVRVMGGRKWCKIDD